MSDYPAGPQLVVVDSAVPDREMLVAAAHLRGQRPGEWSGQADSAKGMLARIAAAVEAADPLPSALHLVAHGGPGTLQLGDEDWTAESVRRRSAEWAAIGKALGPDGVIALTSSTSLVSSKWP